jgi:hypothetical protein
MLFCEGRREGERRGKGKGRGKEKQKRKRVLSYETREKKKRWIG